MKLTPAQQKIFDFLKSHENTRLMKKFGARIGLPIHFTSNTDFEEIEKISSVTFSSLEDKLVIVADTKRHGLGSKHLYKLNPKFSC